MTIRTVVTFAALLSVVTLTGCAAKTHTAGPDSTNTGAASAKVESGSSAATTPASSIGSETVTESLIPSAPNEDAPRGAAATENRTGTAVGGLDVVYFDFDAYLLSAEARETLSRNARVLGANGTRVTLEGHADERGSDEYNLALAEQRAVAVRRYLKSLGIGEERMEVVSYGEDKPAVTGGDEAAWARNRRVEFVILK